MAEEPKSNDQLQRTSSNGTTGAVWLWPSSSPNGSLRSTKAVCPPPTGPKVEKKEQEDKRIKRIQRSKSPTGTTGCSESTAKANHASAEGIDNTLKKIDTIRQAIDTTLKNADKKVESTKIADEKANSTTERTCPRFIRIFGPGNELLNLVPRFLVGGDSNSSSYRLVDTKRILKPDGCPSFSKLLELAAAAWNVTPAEALVVLRLRGNSEMKDKALAERAPENGSTVSSLVILEDGDIADCLNYCGSDVIDVTVKLRESYWAKLAKKGIEQAKRVWNRASLTKSAMIVFCLLGIWLGLVLFGAYFHKGPHPLEIHFFGFHFFVYNRRYIYQVLLPGH